VLAGVEQEKLDGRSIRRSLNQTGRYTRQPNNNAESQQLMEEHGVGYSATGLVAQMREQGNVWQQGEVTVKLAKAYGYCWGVERAVRMAYEAKRSFPDKKLFITNEIIHNPEVNNVSVTALGIKADLAGGCNRKRCCKRIHANDHAPCSAAPA
jgi:4-hydroxy-3-methylbut-2-enyl diphosphate reductase